MTRRRAALLIALGSMICIVILVVESYWWGWYRPIRYYLDLTFNLTKEHISYETGTKYALPLPKRVVWSYRISDNSCAYLTRLTYEDFVSWYEKNGYIIEDNRIYMKDTDDRIWYTVEYQDRDEDDLKKNVVVITRHMKFYN